MSCEKALLKRKIYFDEIQAPKPETSGQAEQGTQTLGRPCAHRSFAGGLAGGLRRQFGREQAFGLENLTRRTVLLRVSGQQPRLEIELPRGDPGQGAGRQFLLMPRLCD